MRDVIVVGGGIVGASVAASLVDAGLTVTVVEASILGGGATAEGMGHLVVIDEPEPEFALCHYSMALWGALLATGMARDEYLQAGTLWIAQDDEEWDLAGEKAARLQSVGLVADRIPGDRLAEWEPELRRDLRGALHVPGDGVVYPPAIVRELLETRAGERLEILEETRVVSMTGREVRTETGGVLACRHVVDAAGVQAATLASGFEIHPRKGHLVITDRYPGFVRHQLVDLGYVKNAHDLTTDSVSFNVQPRPNGQVLIGSTRQSGDPDRAIDPEILRVMMDRAIFMMPRLQTLSVLRAWTGFRAASSDGLPLIGPHPEDPDLFLAAGHEGLGITTSLATAAIVTDLLLGRAPTIDVRPYLPARLWAEHV